MILGLTAPAFWAGCLLSVLLSVQILGVCIYYGVVRRVLACRECRWGFSATLKPCPDIGRAYSHRYGSSELTGCH